MDREAPQGGIYQDFLTWRLAPGASRVMPAPFIPPTPPVIGITLGDPAGIGPEIADAALRSGLLDRDFEYRIFGAREGARPGEPTPESARMARAALEEVAALAGTRQIAGGRDGTDS